MKSPRKRQGPVPQRGPAKNLFNAEQQDVDTDRTDTSCSSDSTVLLDSNDDISEDNSSTGEQIVGDKFFLGGSEKCLCLNAHVMKGVMSCLNFLNQSSWLDMHCFYMHV